MLVVIGSQAVAKSYNIERKFGDMDLVGTYDEIIAFYRRIGAKGITPFAAGKKMVAKTAEMVYEAEIAWEGSTSEALHKLVMADPKTVKQDGLAYASLDVCYLLKMTHRFKKNSPFFLKTLRDIQTMRLHGATIRDEHRDYYDLRLKETLSYTHPKLNQSKKDFFTDDVPYLYDHDSIHLAVALYDKPAYNYYKPDEAEVFCSKELFFAIDEKYRLAGVYEEACVLALERSVIPFKSDPKQAFDMALMKVCTSITSGWFREYAWENYDKVQALYAERHKTNTNGYFSLFNQGLARGIVKPHT